MGALPTTELAGYRILRDRVAAALNMLQEERTVDFKGPVEWEQLKYGIPKDVLAMSNLRDGGIIIIGVSERRQEWELSGMTQEQLDTYDVDNMLDWVNRYASPSITFDVVKHTHYKESEGKNFDFLAIQVHPFEEKPIVCKRDYADGLRKGAFYIRPLGKAESREVQDANEMHDLLELATERRSRNLKGQIMRILGIRPTPDTLEKTDVDKYEEELEAF